MDLDEKIKVAIDLARALIQNSSVLPVYSERRGVVYMIDGARFSFTGLVDMFLGDLEEIDRDFR